MFVLLGLLTTCWIVAKLRRSPFTPAQSLLYALNYVVSRVLWRARLEGALPIRPGHGAVIVCNHRCPLDPSFIAMAVPRVVHWLVVREYCEHPIMGPLLRICEIIPTNRGGTDTAATKSAIRLAAAGELVAIFPEGRINISPEILLPGRPVRPWSP